MNAICIGLIEIHGGMVNGGTKAFSRVQLEYALSRADKDLFVKFREQEMSYDQLRARGASKDGHASYVVLDDIKHKLNPRIRDNLETYKKQYYLRFGNLHKEELTSSFKGPAKLLKKVSKSLKATDLPDPSVAEVTKPLEAWEVNHRCLRSLRYEPNRVNQLLEEQKKLNRLKNEHKVSLAKDAKPLEIEQDKKHGVKMKPKSLEDGSNNRERPTKEYAAKMFKQHQKLVIKNTCFSTNREEKPLKGIGNIDVPSIQFGRRSEYLHLQNMEN